MQTTELCHCHRCAHGCTPETGCQGHAVRAIAPTLMLDQAMDLISEAKRLKMVVTIEYDPDGNDMIAHVRRASGA
jgi:hypothetical protein